MSTATLIPGKDAPLEETIRRTLALLDEAGLQVEPKSWRNPAPHCWSVHLQSTSFPALYTNGKGTTKLACLASALGEFVERLATHFFFSDTYLEQDKQRFPFFFTPDEQWFQPETGNSIPKSNSHGAQLLTPELLSFYNPEQQLSAEHLFDNNSNAAIRGISALPFQDLKTKNIVYFPVSILNNLYVSNGMAAGNSEEECSSQALSEIIERYVKNIIISKGISLPDIPPSTLKGFTKLNAILTKLNNHNFSVQVKDASLGGRYPVICAILTNLSNGGVYASFGANLRFESSIERTLTELLQGRDFEDLNDFPLPCHDLLSVADPFNLESHFVNSDGLLSWDMFQDIADFTYHPWGFTGSSKEEFLKLKELIGNDGYSIYRAEYLQHGMYCCRIVVPGMSEVYPVDDLVWNNKSSGSQLRPHLLNLSAKNTEELEHLLTLLDQLGFNDHHLISDIIGIRFEKKSAWSTLRVAELKLHIYLAANQQQEALVWCNWCVEFGALPEKRRRLFQVLHHLLHFVLADKTIQDYQSQLLLLFSKDEIAEVDSIVSGKHTFPGLSSGASWEDISCTHKETLAIHNICREAHRG